MARTRNLRLRLIRTRCVATAVAAMMGATSCERARNPILLATTTSVGNSGLLDQVLPRYANGAVRASLVGSGRALEMLAAGQADVVISHAPVRETQALAAHPGWWYRKILYNDFLVVGPAEDPARVSRAVSAVDAMRRIAQSEARFLSRGDESGTHERERELWKQASLAPSAERLVIAGAGMGQTLRIASSTGAYTLTDRGTFESLRGSLALVVLCEGDPGLLNTYGVVADPRRERGFAFARWLAEGAGRMVLEEVFSSGRVKGFSIWPASSPGLKPDARPGR